VMVPSKIDSPIWGMTTSVGIVVLPSRNQNGITATARADTPSATEYYSLQSPVFSRQAMRRSVFLKTDDRRLATED
jgi:hypothetical protein